MRMTLEGKAKVRRVGNGLCLPLPARELRAEGIAEGDTVDYIVMKPRRRDPNVFGAARKYLEGANLQKLMDEDRGTAEA